MFGALLKSYYADKVGVDRSKVVTVSVMPCIAKKYECSRPEMEVDGLRDVDIVDSEIQNSNVRKCDIYDTKITNSNIIECNLFGYANCKDSKFKDCFISRNIELKDCEVTGKLGKFGGTMKGGTLKNTTVLVDSADIHDDVEKINVNEIM